MPDVLPTINNEPPQGIQALLDTVYLWNPDVANDLIEKVNELLEKIGGLSGKIPPYAELEVPVAQYTPCYNGDNVYVAAQDLEELPEVFNPSQWILIATKAPVLTAGTGIEISGNEISVTQAISEGAAAGATAIQAADLGTAAYAATTDFATAAQGSLADTALQPGSAVPQYTTMPTASALLEGQVVQYAGIPGSGFVTGYFYKCVSNLDDYTWEQTNVQEEPNIGRFLSLWNCATGLAETNPSASPYEYRDGDYFVVGTVDSTTNYKPSGTSYVIGTPSSSVETSEVSVGDSYFFDGTIWRLQSNSNKTVTFSNIAGDIYGNTSAASALNSKQATLVSGTNIKTINGNSVLGSGNMELSTFLTYPSGWPIDGTTQAFCAAIAADTTATKGKAYLGEVRLTDLPEGIVNSEVEVKIMDGTTAQNKVIVLTLTSGNVAPYMWQYIYWNNGSSVSGWQGMGGMVDSVNNKTGVVVLDASDIGAVPQYTTMPIAGADNLGEIAQYSGETTPDTPAGFSASQTTGTGLTNITVNGQVYIESIGEPITADKTVTLTVDRIDNASVQNAFGYDESNYPLEVINLTEDAHYDPDGVQVTLNVNDFSTLIHSWWTSDTLDWQNIYLTFDGSDWTLSIYDESQGDYAYAHITNDLSDWGITVTKGTPQSGLEDWWGFYPQTPIWIDSEYEYENPDSSLADFWGLTYSGTAVVGDVITWVYKLHGVSGFTNGYFYKSATIAYPASASITQADAVLSDLAIDADVFATQESDSGYYIFEWDYLESSWKKQETSETVNIADYGITYTGAPYGGYAIYVTFIAAESGYAWNRVDVQPSSGGGENTKWVAKADLQTGVDPIMHLRITGGLPDGEYEFYTQVKNNYYESSYPIGYITCKVLLKLTTEEGSQYPTINATVCPVIDGNWAYKTLSNSTSGQTVYFIDGDVVISCGLSLFMSNIPSNTGYSLAVEDCYKVSEFINTATNEKYTPQIELEFPQTYDYITSMMLQVQTIDQMPNIPIYFSPATESISSVQYIQIGSENLNYNNTMDIDVNLACGFDSFQAHIHLYGNGFYKITKQKATGVFENTQFVADSDNNIFVKLNAPVGASGYLYVRVGLSNSRESLWLNTSAVPSTETLLNITEVGGTVDTQNIGDILQYNGTTTASYTNGYFYKATGTVVTIPESVTISEESPNDWTVALTVSVSDLTTAIMNATGWSDPEWIKQYVLTNGNWRIDVDASDNNAITNVYIPNYGDVSSSTILSCFSATTTGSYSGFLNVYFKSAYNTSRQEVQNGQWVRVDTQPQGSAFPSQTGNAGKFLTTDGTDVSWGTPVVATFRTWEANE